MLRFVNFLRSLYLTKRNPYAMLVKVASNQTIKISIQSTITPHRIHTDSIQIKKRNKKQFYIYKHI